MNSRFFLWIILLATTAGAQAPAIATADSLYAVGNYSEAIRILEEKDSLSEAGLIRLAKAHQARGSSKDALEYYEKVLQQNPERVVTAVDYGKLSMKTGKFSTADSVFSALTEKYPESANFHYQLGLAKEKLKDSTATRHFFKAVDFDRHHLQGLIKVSRWALANRKFFMAEAMSSRGLEVYPEHAGLISLLAQAYYHQKRYELAVPHFEKLVDLNKGNEFVHTKLGFCFYRLEMFDKAIEQYNLALSINDMNAQTHYTLGQLYYRKGDYKKAEMSFLMSILMKKQVLDSEYLGLALTYKEMKDFKGASEYIERALGENPDNERALFERAIIADHYIENKEEKLEYYQDYLSKFEVQGDESLVVLAKRRLKDLKEEIHYSR